MVRFLVNRLRIRAARGSRSIGGILNLGDRCSSIRYRGSRGELEKMCLICGASLALPGMPSQREALVGLGGISEFILSLLSPLK